MAQSHKHSAMESVANILVGYVIAMIAQILIFPLFGINLPLGQNLMIGGAFTVVSLIRSYALRRLFNSLRS